MSSSDQDLLKHFDAYTLYLSPSPPFSLPYEKVSFWKQSTTLLTYHYNHTCSIVNQMQILVVGDMNFL